LAVRALKLDNPTDINSRVLAVSEFAQSDNAKALAAANKRVANILAKAEFEDQQTIDAALFEQDEETVLFDAVSSAENTIAPMVQGGNYTEALRELSLLRESVDAFFDKVMVMDENPSVRANRLALLQKLRAMFLSIADISLLTTD